MSRVLQIAELVGFFFLGIAAWVTFGTGAGLAVFGVSLILISNFSTRWR